MGRTFCFNPSIFAWSTSTQVTVLPVSARQPPTTRPTYPVPTTVMFMLLREEPLHRGNDLVELRVRQLGIDGQREHFPRGPLALRALARLVTEVGETGLEMKRKGIVDRRS